MLTSVYVQLAALTVLFTLLGTISSIKGNGTRWIFLAGFSVMIPAAATIVIHGTGAAWRQSLIVTLVIFYTLRMAYVLLAWFKNTGAAKLKIQSIQTRLVFCAILTTTCCWLYCAPFFWAADRQGSFDIWDSLAVILYCTGTIFHFGADWQKRRFRQNPKNKGSLLRKGFWGLCRHPNYFGDFLIYTSFGFLATSPFGIIAPAANLLQYAFDAIPKSEAMNAKRYGEAWQQYSRKVKTFIPYIV